MRSSVGDISPNWVAAMRRVAALGSLSWAISWSVRLLQPVSTTQRPKDSSTEWRLIDIVDDFSTGAGKKGDVVGGRNGVHEEMHRAVAEQVQGPAGVHARWAKFAVDVAVVVVRRNVE